MCVDARRESLDLVSVPDTSERRSRHGRDGAYHPQLRAHPLVPTPIADCQARQTTP